jgi:ATP-dependent RNA helicase RhlE
MERRAMGCHRRTIPHGGRAVRAARALRRAGAAFDEGTILNRFSSNNSRNGGRSSPSNGSGSRDFAFRGQRNSDPRRSRPQQSIGSAEAPAPKPALSDADAAAIDTSAFAALGIKGSLLKALAGEGYSTPTPIQMQGIPPILEGKDLLGIAQTGTGKTAAFALPILQRLAADPKPAPRRGARVLVLSPTRELATQIADSFRAYGRHMNIRVAVIFGGVGHRPQIDALIRGLDVLVATPGRLLDHLQERAADLSNTEIFVLDEADQMLDLGFIKPIQSIVRHLPRERLNLFFSATMPQAIGELAGELLRDPVRVAVTPVAKTADRVEQRVIHVPNDQKRNALVNLMRDEAPTRTIVFTRTKRGADKVAEHLEGAGIAAAAIHGNKSQSNRERALSAFRAGSVGVLVATDIAARGIDIPAVSHVVNFELPEVPEAYVHRIGRTARAGAEGKAVSFCAPAERDLLKAIERLTRQSIPSERSPLAGDPRPAPGTATGARDARPARGERPAGERLAGDRPAGERFEQGRGAPRARSFEPRAQEPRAPRDQAPRSFEPRSFEPRLDARAEKAPRDTARPASRPEGRGPAPAARNEGGAVRFGGSGKDSRPEHRADARPDARQETRGDAGRFRGERPAGQKRPAFGAGRKPA